MIQTPVKKFGGGNIIMALHKTYDACVFCFAIVACIAINSQIFLQQYLPKLWLIKTLGIILKVNASAMTKWRPNGDQNALVT